MCSWVHMYRGMCEHLCTCVHDRDRGGRKAEKGREGQSSLLLPCQNTQNLWMCLFKAMTNVCTPVTSYSGASHWLSGEESTCNAGDVGSIPGSGRSPGRGHGNPLQYSCLGNPMDRGDWWATVRAVTHSWTWLRDWACIHNILAIISSWSSLGPSYIANIATGSHRTEHAKPGLNSVWFLMSFKMKLV